MDGDKEHRRKRKDLSDRLLPCQQYQSVAGARVRLPFKSGLGFGADDDNVSHRRQFA